MAWTGSGTSPGNWRDNSFRVRGPAVDGMRGALTVLWAQAPHALVTAHDRFPPLPSAGSAAVQVLRPSSAQGWGDTSVAFAALLMAARRQVRIAGPYGRFPTRLLRLLEDAPRRGVHVQLLLPGPRVDHPLGAAQGEHQHERLLDAGVEIWRYQPSMLHSKVVTVDGSVAMVGSANLDARSFALNEQVQLLISDTATTGVLDGHFDEDLTRSRRADVAQWRRRGLRRRALESVADVVGRPVRGLGSAGLTGRRP